MKVITVVVTLLTLGLGFVGTVPHRSPVSPATSDAARALGPAFVTSGIEVLCRHGW